MQSLSSQISSDLIKEVTPNSFIFEIENALPKEICAEMISRFENNPSQQYFGRLGQQQNMNRDIKRSTDLVVSGKSDWQDIEGFLFRSATMVLEEFRESYAFFRGAFKDMGYAIQRTRPGEGYHWHIDGGSHEFSQRQLVIVWYLNDVAGPGGETEFLFQNVKVKPSAGKMVIFPPFWTHEHQGVTLEQGVKYIATTWIIFA
ncbi:MAG: 2OG-Fe(II) oxygenase [Methylococcales bacterium]|jgi:hypothetical protein|nr:2OG-Fe(II) oxygenase [Methylococcales bacterium]MBT7409150.1 2OG-Fe(II) oxygenase [Methylococcales bacterium]